MWLRAVCTFPSLCSLMLAVCGHLTREQFTLVARPVPGEVNTHRHTHTHKHTETKRDPEQGNCYTHTHTDRNLLWWSSYGLQNKHTHTLLWPNLGRRSFRPTHAAGQHNGSVCTHSNIQLTGANWRTENTPRGGRRRRLPSDPHTATNLPTPAAAASTRDPVHQHQNTACHHLSIRAFTWMFMFQQVLQKQSGLESFMVTRVTVQWGFAAGRIIITLCVTNSY